MSHLLPYHVNLFSLFQQIKQHQERHRPRQMCEGAGDIYAIPTTSLSAGMTTKQVDLILHHRIIRLFSSPDEFSRNPGKLLLKLDDDGDGVLLLPGYGWHLSDDSGPDGNAEAAGWKARWGSVSTSWSLSPVANLPLIIQCKLCILLWDIRNGGHFSISLWHIGHWIVEVGRACVGKVS